MPTPTSAKAANDHATPHDAPGRDQPRRRDQRPGSHRRPLVRPADDQTGQRRAGEEPRHRWRPAARPSPSLRFRSRGTRPRSPMSRWCRSTTVTRPSSPNKQHHATSAGGSPTAQEHDGIVRRCPPDATDATDAAVEWTDAPAADPVDGCEVVGGETSRAETSVAAISSPVAIANTCATSNSVSTAAASSGPASWAPPDAAPVATVADTVGPRRPQECVVGGTGEDRRHRHHIADR